MPRIANETGALLADLEKRLARLVDVARKEGREEALAEVRALVAGGAGAAKPGRKTTKKAAQKAAKKTSKPRKKRKNPWDSMTPAQRKERIRKMQAGRGLKPKFDR